jgi:hypothetical protein
MSSKIPKCLIDHIIDEYRPHQIESRQNFAEVLCELNSGRFKQKCGKCTRLINSYIEELADEINGHTLFYCRDNEVVLANCEYDFNQTNYNKIRLWCSNCIPSFYGN